MSVEFINPLLDALKERLSEALVASGVPEEQGGLRPPVPVFTSITSEFHRIFVRIEATSMVEGETGGGAVGFHSLSVRVVHVGGGASDVISDPEVELPRVAGLIRAALKAWRPLAQSGEMKFRGGFFAAEEDAETDSYVLRLTVNITGD